MRFQSGLKVGESIADASTRRPNRMRLTGLDTKPLVRGGNMTTAEYKIQLAKEAIAKGIPRWRFIQINRESKDATVELQWSEAYFHAKSGFDLCPHCESEKSGKNIPVGATICAHGVEPYDCRVCFPIDQPIHKKECTARTGGECNCGLSWKVPSLNI